MTTHLPRPGRLDVALTVVLALLGTALMVSAVVAPPQAGFDDPGVLAIPLFLLVTLPLLWRSAAPLHALGAVLGGLLVHTLLFGDIVRCGVAFAVTAVLAFAVAARLEGRDALLGLALAVTTVLLAGAGDALGMGVASVGVPLVLIGWGTGRFAHSRGRLAVELGARNRELQLARDERARLEVATDRAQLSHDLDRLLHRRLDALGALADQGVVAVADGSAATVLRDIEHESRATLNEMRQLVGVLRSDDGTATTAPQPTLTSLEALLVRSRGRDARLTVEGDPRALPAAVELSAYRVVEHLLSGLDDAPGAEVHVRFLGDTLELAVAGPARRRGADAGAALARARERVELHRGSLRTTTLGGRSEAVAALPLLSAA